MASTLPIRGAAVVMLAALVAGCTTMAQRPEPPPAPRFSALDVERYGEVDGEPFHVPAVSLEDLQPRNLRQLVEYRTKEAPGTIVVDPKHRFLYLVQEGGKALRYGVGVGREGLAWIGQCRDQARVAELDADSRHDPARARQICEMGWRDERRRG